MNRVFVGDDWAEGHHDIHVMDSDGSSVRACRLVEGLEGVARLHGIIEGLTDDPAEVYVAIETDRGLWVSALVAAGYQVFAINPLSAARYRDRHAVGGAKSDRGDAKTLAEIVRVDRHNQRLVASDSAAVEGIKALARAHQNLVWARCRHTNQLRSALREYFPAALSAFEDLADRDAVAVLQRFPGPRSAARASTPQLRAALRRGGRTRNLDRRAADIRQHLQVRHLQAPDAVADAFAASVQAQAAVVAVLNEQIHHLEAEIADGLATHPDTETLASLPGLGPILAARVLGEFGDDPTRYPTAKARKNYAGTSPLTVASGKKCTVTARYVRNKRLYDAIDQWAFCSLTRSRGCRAFYDARRAKGDSHHQALRALGNRLVGVLHGCLSNHSHYSEEAAWGHRHDTAHPIPA